MESNTRDKSRKEKRKEARKERNQNKHNSWLEQQRLLRVKRLEQAKKKIEDSKPKKFKKSGTEKKERDGSVKEGIVEREQSLEKENEVMELESELAPSTVERSIVSKTRRKVNSGVKRKSGKTRFEKFLEMEKIGGDALAEMDLETEKRLAKKLKIKSGMLGGIDDGLDLLFEGIPSVLHDSVDGGFEDGTSNKKRRKQGGEEELPEMENGFDDDDMDRTYDSEEALGMEIEPEKGTTETSSRKKRKKRKKSKQKQADLEVDTACDGSESVETHDATEVMVQENATKTTPVASGSKYIAPHLRSRAGNELEEHTQIRRRVHGLLAKLSESHVEYVTKEMATIFRSVSRSVSSQLISDEALGTCSEQDPAVLAAFVAGMACSVGMDFSARLIAALAKTFEDEYLKEDRLSLEKLTLFFSYLYFFGVFSSDLVYDFLLTLGKRLSEIDVDIIDRVLQCCGMNIRGDDPTAMKNFIQSVWNKMNELKASSSENGNNISGKKMEFQLETILSDIKNNKKKSKEETVPYTRIKKWLQKLRVEDILIRGLTWNKLLDPNKKGQWWLSGDVASTTDNIEEVANAIDKEAQEAQKMLQLAAGQRMNTDARRGIFCIIMSAEDYVDAFEKLLLLDLPGKQDREIIRVLVECCLQEKVFNKYYTILASKLCEHDKNHKFTLQYCLWDHFKELDSMPLLRSMHLAKFTAEMVASFNLSLAVLKTVELIDAGQLTPKTIMHFRMLFESIFEQADRLIWNIFTRVAVAPELETLRSGVEFFIKEYVVKNNNALANKFKLARKALNNTEGVLM